MTATKMNHQLCVLLYSKYSQMSNELVNMIQSSHVDLKNSVGLSLVCVDNESIRKKIQSATSVQVDTVPTILILYDNGSVEKYEGITAFQWTNQTIKQLTPQPVQVQKQQPVQVQQPVVEPEHEHEPEPEQSIRRSKPIGKSTRKSTRKSTPINELESESESQSESQSEAESEEYDSDNYLPSPPTGIRNGAGGYEITKDFNKIKRPSRGDESVKNNETEKSKSNLMAMAQAMQKGRE